ncbi:MAG: hypothetical protein HYW26_05570 [Candidatus Aenigmarchaeota archaeon]|nr:hypothetical protein [Candidatus Aenigmarchaeota archaeon]
MIPSSQDVVRVYNQFASSRDQLDDELNRLSGNRLSRVDQEEIGGLISSSKRFHLASPGHLYLVPRSDSPSKGYVLVPPWIQYGSPILVDMVEPFYNAPDINKHPKEDTIDRLEGPSNVELVQPLSGYKLKPKPYRNREKEEFWRHINGTLKEMGIGVRSNDLSHYRNRGTIYVPPEFDPQIREVVEKYDFEVESVTESGIWEVTKKGTIRWRSFTS